MSKPTSPPHPGLPGGRGQAYRGEEHGVEVDRGLDQEGALQGYSNGGQEHEVAEREQKRCCPLLGYGLRRAVVGAAPASPTWAAHNIPRCELLNPEGCCIDGPNGVHGYRRRKPALVGTGIDKGGQAWASGDKSVRRV